MEKYIVMCRSVTSAQRCASLLEKNLVRASVTRAPRSLSSGGCAYGIVVHKKLKEAVEVLRKNEMPIGRIYALESGGGYREVSL